MFKWLTDEAKTLFWQIMVWIICASVLVTLVAWVVGIPAEKVEPIVSTPAQITTQETTNETTIATMTSPTEATTTVETVAPVALSTPTATTTTTNATTTAQTTEQQTTTTESLTLEVPRFYLTDEERRIAERMVMGEAGAESYEGQVLVAQCILNACLLEGWQPSQVRVNYRYAGWHDEPSQSVKDAVSAVFDHGFEIVSEPIVYFYAPKLCQSKWHESQTWVITEGGHKFFMNNQ